MGIDIFIFILGTAIGSFINVIADRLPKGESLHGRSHCDHCHYTLEWFTLIPIFSLLALRRRCYYCHKKLSWNYPLSEVLTGVIFVIIWHAAHIPQSVPSGFIG